MFLVQAVEHEKLGTGNGIQYDKFLLWGTTDLSTAIDSLGIWQNQLHLFRELNQPGAGVPGGGDQDLRVSLFSVGILVIDVRTSHCCVVIFQLYFFP